MAGLRVHTVMPAELVARIDAALLDGVSRGEFVRRAVEQALVTEAGGGSPGVSKASLPAPAEQPVQGWDDEAAHREANLAFRRQAARSHAPNCKCPVCS